jgi:hypothetical protein
MIKGVFVLLLLSALAMVFDYARIRMVVDVRTSALLATLAGARFSLKNFPRAYGLYLLLSLIGILLVAVYALLEAQVAQHSYWLLVLVFLLQQFYMVGRMWLKAGFYSCQTHLYRSRVQAEVLREPAPEVSPTA